MKKITLLGALLGSVFAANALVYNVTVPTGTKACYIAGDMTSWAHQEMTKLDDTHYTIDIPSANQTHGYKYSSGPGWEYVEKTAEGQEMGNRTYSANDVVADWAKVYEPGVVIPDIPAGTKLYLKPNANWLSNNARFAVYFFKNTDNTWVDMTLVDASQNIYEVIVPAGTWNTLIFCRMNPDYTENQWNSGVEGAPQYVWSQTANLNYDEINNLYAINENADEWSAGEWEIYTPVEPSEGITVKVQIPEGLSYWNDENGVYFYVWTTGEGTFIPATDEGNRWYSYSTESTPFNFIVVNGSNWPNGTANQTVNMENVTASACYVLANGEQIEENGDSWKKTLTATDCPSESPSTIVEITENAPLFTINGRTLNVSMDNEAEISIYTISGQMIEHTVASNFTREMQQGVYVVRIGNQAQKLVVF